MPKELLRGIGGKGKSGDSNTYCFHFTKLLFSFNFFWYFVNVVIITIEIKLILKITLGTTKKKSNT